MGVLATKDGCVVNIVNDKLTLAVFSLLQENLSKVKEINFVTTFSPDLVGNIVNKGSAVYLYFKEEERKFLGYKYKLQSEKLTPDSSTEYYWGARPE